MELPLFASSGLLGTLLSSPLHVSVSVRFSVKERGGMYRNRDGQEPV